MKIICLDIDGVLNTFFTKERIEGYIFVEPAKIELLKQLIDRTDAKVLLTSTWRHGWRDLERNVESVDKLLYVALSDKLLEFGVELFDYTPITNGSIDRRGEEIAMWMENWKGEPVESMVLLDDLNGVYLRPYSHRLVRTSAQHGLTQKHVDMAVKVLETPMIYKDGKSCSTKEILVKALTEMDKKSVTVLDELSGNAVEMTLESENYAWGIFVDGILVGYCTIGGAEDPTFGYTVYKEWTPNALLLGDVFIHKEYRNNGYASRMIKEVLEKANTTGNAVFLTLLDDNLVELYAKIGFKYLDDGDMVKCL